MIGRGVSIALIAAAGLAAQTEILLTSPKDYQVFQRQTPATGVVLVQGEFHGACDAVAARAAGGDWLPLRLSAGHFDGRIAAPAGPFFAVEVRCLHSGQTMAETVAPHVGIGEVFVIAGQSNSTNYGEETQQPKSGMVVAFDGETWRPAADPQPGVQDNSHNGSFIPAFGDALYQKVRVPIAVACVGAGSTSVRQWLPAGVRFQNQPTMTRFAVREGDGWQSTGQLFDGMMRRIQQLERNGFRALLWHQGESDAHQPAGHEISAETYRSLMEQLIRSSREQAGWNFPWVVAQASYHTPSDPSDPGIRAAQADLWKSGLALPGPDTDRLTGSYRQNNGQGVHFSSVGLQAHGRLWAEKVIQAFWPAE